MDFSQPLSAQAQQARKIYTSSALEYNGSVLFRINYNSNKPKYGYLGLLCCALF